MSADACNACVCVLCSRSVCKIETNQITALPERTEQFRWEISIAMCWSVLFWCCICMYTAENSQQLGWCPDRNGAGRILWMNQKFRFSMARSVRCDATNVLISLSNSVTKYSDSLSRNLTNITYIWCMLFFSISEFLLCCCPIDQERKCVFLGIYAFH